MSVTYDFSGQVALVTGAAMGMGAAAARGFAAAGAAVALLDIDRAAAEAVAEEIRAQGGEAVALRCDVADEAEVKAAVEATVARFGRLDMAHNNAGVQAPPAEIQDQPSEAFDRVVAINLRGTWLCMKYEIAQMRKQGSGAIVNCASIGGVIGGPTLAAYHGTKHGVIGLTRSAALENARKGIRVNAVAPGTINTPMVAEMMQNQPENMAGIMQRQAIGRLGEPEEVAAAVLWLASPAASFILGATLLADGGFTA